MVRVRDVAWALAALALYLAGLRPAHADPVTLTGNVASDFTTSNGSTMIPSTSAPGTIAGPVPAALPTNWSPAWTSRTSG